MVEAAGIEPASESALTGLSPGAAAFQHSLLTVARGRHSDSVESSCVGGATLTRRTDAT